MTERYAALTIILEQNMRDDDAEPLIAAIRQLRGVLDVQPVPASIELMIAESRARRDLIARLYAVLEDPPFGMPIKPDR
jgi:hypothetical protein